MPISMGGSFPIALGGAINVDARQTRFIGPSDIIAFKMRFNGNFFRSIMSREVAVELSGQNDSANSPRCRYMYIYV